MASPGTMKQTPPISPPSRPRNRQAQKMASWVDAGPGRRLVAEMPSSNSGAVSQWWSSTQSWRNRAMWAGGPPNPMAPMRPHSRAILERGTLSLAGSVTIEMGSGHTVAGVSSRRYQERGDTGDGSTRRRAGAASRRFGDAQPTLA